MRSVCLHVSILCGLYAFDCGVLLWIGLHFGLSLPSFSSVLTVKSPGLPSSFTRWGFFLAFDGLEYGLYCI